MVERCQHADHEGLPYCGEHACLDCKPIDPRDARIAEHARLAYLLLAAEARP